MTNPDHDDARSAALSKKDREGRAEVAREKAIARDVEDRAQEVLRVKRERRAALKAEREAKSEP